MAVAGDESRDVQRGAVRALGDRVGERLTPRVLALAAVAGFTLVIVGCALVGFLRPAHNWDMAPYIAVSLEDRIGSPQALHDAAFSAMREGISPEQWYAVTQGNAYIADQYANPAHFVSQLPMYRVKIAYVEAIRLLDRLVSPVTATAIVAAVSTLALGAALMLWAVRGGFVQGLLFAAPLLLLLDYLSLAMAATPDMMMAAFALPGIWMAARGRPWFAVPFLLAAFLVRPGTLVLLFALLLAALAFRRDRLAYATGFLAALLLYGPITQGAGHPGWWPHFYFSIIEQQSDMRGFSPAFDPMIYLTGLVRGFVIAVRDDAWPMLAALLGLGWLALVQAGHGGDRCRTMALTALALCLAGKFASFPLPGDRVYFPIIAGFAMTLLSIWKPDLSTPRRGRRTAAQAPA